MLNKQNKKNSFYLSSSCLHIHYESICCISNLLCKSWQPKANRSWHLCTASLNVSPTKDWQPAPRHSKQTICAWCTYFFVNQLISNLTVCRQRIEQGVKAHTHRMKTQEGSTWSESGDEFTRNYSAWNRLLIKSSGTQRW